MDKIVVTTLSPIMGEKENEALYQYAKCCGCSFNRPYEPKIRGCGSETCFVDANYQIRIPTDNEWNNDWDKGYKVVNKKMKYQICNMITGDIVDRNLSYEAALMYIDNVVGKYYVMKPMKEDGQDDCDIV